MKSKAIALALALLWLTVIAVFWRALFTSDVPFFRDVSMAHVPRLIELRNLVSGGQWPFWNPFEHFGEPVAVNPNYLLFYPTTWIGWLLPPVYAFKLHYVLHFLLGATGSFLLARRLKLPASCCFLAGGLFVFAGPVISLGNFYNTVATVAWVPLVLLAADYHAERGGLKGAGALAAAMTFQTLSGEPVTALATAVLALGWMLACYGEFRGALHSPANRKVFTRFLLAGLLAAGFSAIQVLPAFRHVFLTDRGALENATALYWSLLPLKILEILVPDFWGNQLQGDSPWVYIEGGQPYLLLSVFVGIIPLTLAIRTVLGCGLSIPRLKLFRRPRPVPCSKETVAFSAELQAPSARPTPELAARFWALAGVVLLILAFGRYTPAWYPFYYVLPLFRIFRFPVKFVSLFVLAVAQLSAIGLARMVASSDQESVDDSARQFRRERCLRHGLVVLALGWSAASLLIVAWPSMSGRLIAAFAGRMINPAVALGLRQALADDRATMVRQAVEWLAFTIPAKLPHVLGSSAIAFAMLWPPLTVSFRRKLAYTAASLALVQMIAAHIDINPVVSARLYNDRPPVVEYLNNRSAAGEKVSPAGEGRSAHLPARVFVESNMNPPSMPPQRMSVDIEKLDFLPPSAQPYYVWRQSLQAVPGTFGLEGTFAYDTERLLSKQNALVNWMGSQITGENLVRLLQRTSVDYAVLLHLHEAAGLEQVGVFANGSTNRVRLYRVHNALPRAYLVPAGGALWATPTKGTLERMLAPTFDPSRQVMLDPESGTGSGGAASFAASAEAFTSSAVILQREALRVVLNSRSNGDAWLILNDSYSPDWKVSVDGKRAPLWRANQCFRAVRLPAGPHSVEFVYRPVALMAGAAITLFTWLAYLVAYLYLKARRRPGWTLAAPG